MNWPAIVERGIARGLVRRNGSAVVMTPKFNPSVYMRRRRAWWHLFGLTSAGKEPLNKRHPELLGLKGKPYHHAYYELTKG